MTNQNFFLATAKSLSGRKISISDDISPMRSLAITGAAFKRSYKNFIDDLKKMPLDRKPVELSSSFVEMTYRASELFEAFSNIPTAVDQLSKRIHKDSIRDYKTTLNAHRNDWSFICNKVKHNYNTVMIFHYFTKYNDLKVPAFMLWMPKPHDSWHTNGDFHKKGEGCRSLPMTARKVIHDIYCVDSAAARLIERTIEDSDEQIASQDIEILDSEILPEVRSLPTVAIDKERNSYSSLLINPLKLINDNSEIIKTGADWNYTMNMTKDSNVRYYSLPGTEDKGEMKFTINGVTMPIPFPD